MTRRRLIMILFDNCFSHCECQNYLDNNLVPFFMRGWEIIVIKNAIFYVKNSMCFIHSGNPSASFGLSPSVRYNKISEHNGSICCSFLIENPSPEFVSTQAIVCLEKKSAFLWIFPGLYLILYFMADN